MAENTKTTESTKAAVKSAPEASTEKAAAPTAAEKTTAKKKCENYLPGLPRLKIKLVKKIVDETGAKIVVSSSWRHGLERHFAHVLEKAVSIKIM